MEDEGHDKLVKRTLGTGERITKLENRVQFLCTVLARVARNEAGPTDLETLERMGRDGTDQEEE